jgi:sugar phosphate isomerase/epimerase
MQIDLRSRDDLDSIREKLLAFQEGSPLTNISLHGTTPLIDAETLGVKDGEKLRQAIRLAIECGCDMYTVHPPKISREIFSNLMPEQQKTIIDAYATFFAESIKRAVDSKKSLVVAIENMPTKGGGGGFGQSPEEIKAVVGRVVETLVEQHGFGSFDAERFVGVTFDVDHALIGADPGRQETVIREWLDALGSKIKAFHIYAPSGPGLGFDQKLSQFLKLYKEYGLDVPIYLESKQKPETTRDVFLSGRENLEIQIEAGDERSKMFTSGSWQNNAGREG